MPITKSDVVPLTTSFFENFILLHFKANLIQDRGRYQNLVTFKMEFFSTIANSWEPLAIVAINSALNVVGFLDPSLTMNNRVAETFAVSLVKVLKRIL